MEVSRRRDLWTFAILFTSLEMAFMMIAQLWFYPPELHAYILAREPLLMLMVSLPVCLYLGGKMHETHLRKQELRAMVRRDRLTNVATRDFFYERLAQDPDAYGVSLMVDIDHFKQVNDTHGHLVGDAVIRGVAEVLKANCREEDIVCRFGGEEFAIFLHHVTPEQGQDIAERMRKRVAEATITTRDIALSATVSIGGSLKAAAQDINTSISKADAALYNAKAGGRNRAVMSWAKDCAA